MKKQSAFKCSDMKEIYNMPNIEKVEIYIEDIVATSQLENVGSLDNWENVGKPTWGNGGKW